MTKTGRYIVALLAVILSGIALAEAQTWYYKRVKVVDERAGGTQTSKNDDAHYITFNPQSCYASDGNGMAVNSAQALRYVKRDNGIDIYWGTSIYGSATYEDLKARRREEASRLGVEGRGFQSNHEGARVDAIQQA